MTTTPPSIPYAIYGAPFFVRNDFERGRARSYLVVRDETTFRRVFGIGMTMGATAPPIGPDFFAARMLLVAIERGPRCRYTVEAVRPGATTLRLSYALACGPRESASFAVPLIVAVPRSDATVTFVENGTVRARVRAR